MGKARKVVKFIGSFPPIQSAIKVDGNGDGLRMQIDVPRSELPNAIGAMEFLQKAFQVTLTEVDDETEEGAKGSSSNVGHRRIGHGRD